MHSTRFQTITLKDERRVITVEKSINNLGRENPEQQGTPENLEVSLICSQREGIHQKRGSRKSEFPDKKLVSFQLDPVVNSQKQPPEVFCEKRFSLKFSKIHRETPVLVPLF